MNYAKILSQILGSMAVLFWIWSVQNKNKDKILKLQGFANAFYAGQYLVLGITSAASMNLVSILRSTIFYENYKKKKENSLNSLLIFLGLTIILGIINFNTWMSIIPIIITLFYTYAAWKRETKIIRWTFLIAAIVWIYYNIKVGAYISLVGNAFEMISGIIAIIRFDLEKKKQ